MPFTTVPGAKLYWKLEGRDNAQPLVLLNSIGTDMDLWDAVLPELRGRFSLLRIDTRGHGASNAEPGDISLKTLAADVLAVANAAQFSRFSLAGVSLGGMVGMELALSYPESVDRLVLICTSASMDQAAWKDRAATARAKGMGEIAGLVMDRFLSDDFREFQSPVAETVRRQLLAMNPESYASCAAAISDMDLAGRIEGIRAPTLIVTGVRDISTPFAEHGKHLLAQIPRARHAELDAAHLAPLEAPGPLAQTLLAFCADPT